VLCPDGTGFTATVRQGRVLSSSQAQSNSLALSLACADAQRMRICPSAGLDMPLDQAVWVPTQNALVGVRGGYLFRFDANGMFQSKSRFSKMTLYGSSICYDSTRDRLFVATKDDPGWEGDLNAGTTYSPFRVIRRIDPATFTVEATFSPDTFFSNNAGVGNSGPMRVLAVGGLIYCSYSLGNGNIITNDPGFVGVFDPSGLTLSRQTQAFLEDGWCEIVDLNANYWMATDIGSGVIQIFSKPSVGDPFGNPVDFITAREIASALLKMPCGACIDPGSTNIFMVCRDSQFVMRRDSTVGGAHAGMDIALPAGSTPYCARYGLGKVYVAGLSNDTVSIINPADNSVANKTGFDGPFDIVFTPTKAFAVQIGQQGLKEIV
jgi:YVTN family beta-propeller protein